MNELVLGRRALLRAAAASGAGLGLAHALPAWAQPLSKGLVRPLPTVSGTDISLAIGKVSVEVDGKVSRAIGINGTVPGPLIRLKEGQRVRLRVQNTLDEESSIHWHGLLVPFAMDGVPGVSFPGIMPRSTFDYEFDVIQSGTYWYHSHSAYQEEDGVYGPIVIDPADVDSVAYDREHVLVLSDHSPLTGATIYKKLKQMGGGYFNMQRLTLSGLLAGRDLPASERREWAKMRMPEHAALGHCTPASIQQRTPPPPASTPQVQSTCLPEHAAMGHCTLAAPQPAPPQSQPAPQAQAACLPEHAAMGHCTVATPAPAMQPQVACLPEHAAAGHCVPQAAGVPEGTDLAAGNAPAPPVPTANAADSIYGPEAMAMGRHHLQEFHGGQKLFQVLANIAEYRANRGANGFGWELEGWYGGDINRFWFKSEGEGAFGEGVESAEVQALYSHAIGPYWNVQGGVRYDFKPSPSRVYATVQLEGLAPSFFDVEGALFLSDKGELMARVGGYYDQRITQRLILQPRVEFDLAAQDSPEIGVGAGLSEGEIGVRLRYDIRREFAPYIGIQYQRAFGRTARYLRDEGEDVGGFQFLVGVRTWF